MYIQDFNFYSGVTKRWCLLVAAVMLLGVLPQYAATVPDRQSVGLVLSGGGAKGIAHIGVIKALEDNDIPIDYITGTSMGAIVGGLYASGYSPEEMMELLESKGFSYWSTGTIDPSLTYYYAKDDPTPKLASFNLSLTDSADNNILPTSIISPLPMNYAFMELFAKYSAQCHDDFDRLFVPFRCVTSDIYHKHKIVCRDGSLGDAIRASMSFPIVFHPIEMNGILVYDGGIYDNFPVDVMREEFSPGIMLGVDVSSPDKKPEVNNLVQQIEDMIIQKNDYSLPDSDGIKLRIELSEFGLLDFPKCREIYKIGYDYAMSMMDSIKSRVTARVPADSVIERRSAFKAATPEVVFDSVHVEGGTKAQNEFLKYLFTNGTNDTFGLEHGKLAYYRAISSGKLRNLTPKAEWSDSTGMFKLNLRADVKNDFVLGGGGYISSSTNSMLFFSAGYNTLDFHSFNVLAKGWLGQSYMAGVFETKYEVRTAIPSYIKFQGVISRHKMGDTNHLFYDESNSLVTASEAFVRLRYGMAAGRSGELEADLGLGRISNRFYPGLLNKPHPQDRGTYALGQVRLHYEQNTLNDDLYATQGKRIRSMLVGVYGGYDYFPANDKAFKQHTSGVNWLQLSFDYQGYRRLNKHISLGFEASAMISTKEREDEYAATMVMLPVFNPTPSTHISFNRGLRAPQYFTAGVLPVWQISKMLQARGEFHCFMPWRKVLPGLPDEKGVMKAEYGGWFSDPAFFGEVSAVYVLPFAHLCVYANYCNAMQSKWNVGLSFGLFFLAPSFMH